MGHDQTALNPSQDRRLLIIGVVDVRHILQDRKDLGQQIMIRRKEMGARVDDGRRDVLHFFRNGVRILDEVRKSGGNGVPRHTVEFCGFRRLDDDHAVLLLYGTDPAGAVGTSAGKDHRNGAVLICLGQRSEEYVNGMIDPLRIIFPQAQNVLLDLHIIFRRDHVDMIPLHHHPVPDLCHRHPAVLRKDIRHQAFMIRSQVLYDHKRHPRIGRKECKKLLQCFQPAGGRTDPDNTVRLQITGRILSVHILTPFVLSICI